MNVRVGIIVLFVGAFLSNCSLQNSNPVANKYQDYDMERVPYKLYEPDSVVKLHYDLEEISGLSYYSDNVFLAIEDEGGKIYFIDATSGKILKKRKFAKSGDYESIELINELVYIMQSDGDLFEFDLSKEDKAAKIKTQFSIKNDMEGMGLWSDKLIVATKASGDVGESKLKGKGVYLVDPETGDLSGEAIIEIKLKELKSYVKDREFFNDLDDFDPSGIAVHPITYDIYILSADNVLLIYSDKFKLKEVVKLNPKLMRQPEGICFSPNGVLFISSEGDGARARLLKYSVF